MGDYDRVCEVCEALIPERTSGVEMWVHNDVVDGKSLVPQSTDCMGVFCVDCADAKKAVDLEELVCSACGVMIPDGNSMWTVQVERSAHQGAAVDIEYSASPKQYCESCAPKADLWRDAYEAIQSILKPELKHKFAPFQKKYDILTVDRCGGCGKAYEKG